MLALITRLAVLQGYTTKQRLLLVVWVLIFHARGVLCVARRLHDSHTHETYCQPVYPACILREKRVAFTLHVSCIVQRDKHLGEENHYIWLELT